MKRSKRSGSDAAAVTTIDDSDDTASDGDADSVSNDDLFTEDDRRVSLSKKYLSSVRRELVPAVGNRPSSNDDDEQTDVPVRAVSNYSETFLRGHKQPCTSVAVDKHTSTVFTGGKDCAVLQWDIGAKSKRVYAGQRNNVSCGGHYGAVLSMDFDQHLRLLVTVGADHHVRLWDPRTDCGRGAVDAMKGHKDKVTAVCCDPASQAQRSAGNGARVFTGSLDKTVKVWDLSQRSYTDTLLGHTDGVCAMSIGAHGKPITGGLDKTARLWKTELDTHLVFQRHTSAVDAVTCVSDKKFATAGQDGDIHLWSTTKAKPIASLSQAHAGEWMTALSHSTATETLTSAGADGKLRMWSVSEDAQGSIALAKEFTTPGYVNAIAQGQGFIVCATGQENRLGRWDRKSGKNGILVVSQTT